MNRYKLNSDAVAAQLKDSMTEHNVMQNQQLNQIQPPLIPYDRFVDRLYPLSQFNPTIINLYKTEQEIRITFKLNYESFAVWYKNYALTMYSAYTEQLQATVEKDRKKKVSLKVIASSGKNWEN